MGNAIQFGIYRIGLLVLLLFISHLLYSQDYVVDFKGDTQEVVISNWFGNSFVANTNQEKQFNFTNSIKYVYRSQSEVVYTPYTTFVKNQDYVDFYLPTVQSIRDLQVDYFRDENVEVWVSGEYLLYKILSNLYVNEKELAFWTPDVSYLDELNNKQLFESKNRVNYVEIPKDVIFIYHDSVGFDKIVADDIQEDYFKLLISRYTFDSELNDSIFGDDFKLKQKKFLDFFDENVSTLTQVLYSDRDMAEYYIASLREGALIVLLNLDKRKIDLYRNSGNTKLADELEAKLLSSNRSMAISFIDSVVFSFCEVYIADAKNRSLILDGVRENIFLNDKLEVDSSITMTEDFFLFARRGQVFETRLIDQTNPHLKQTTSNPVVQDALVIYDHENIQVMDPFPMYVREATAVFKGKSKKQKNDEEKNDEAGFDDEKGLYDYLVDAYDYPDLEKSKVNVALALNSKFIRFHNGSFKSEIPGYRKFLWKNENIWQNGSWRDNPFLFLNHSHIHPTHNLNHINFNH